MKKFRVTFDFMGQKQREVVEAVNVFTARNQIENKYGEDMVDVFVVAPLKESEEVENSGRN